MDAYEFADKLIDGGLVPQLHAWRAERLSVEEITYRLRGDYGVKVSANTVWRWLQRNGMGRLERVEDVEEA